VVATIAFGLFGLRSRALTLLMLGLMALSAVAFICRFRGPMFAGVVILYFTALTVMLFTSIVWDPQYRVNIPVGGIRYFSLVTVLPTFHILLQLLELQPVQSATAKRNSLLLGIQTGILALAILVRGSALPLVGAIATALLIVAWRFRNNPDRRRLLFGNAKLLGLVTIGFLAVLAVLIPPNYVTEGRFGTVIWQRVTESLGTNPAWPFPGV